MASSGMLFDTSLGAQQHLSYSNVDSLDFSRSIMWQVNGGKDMPSFRDTLLPPQKATIIFPDPKTKNIMPRQPLLIKYDVVGVDSVYLQLLIFDSSYFNRLSIHTANTGIYDMGTNSTLNALISSLPAMSEIHVSIVAATQKLHRINGQIYLIRAGIIDNASVTFSN